MAGIDQDDRAEDASHADRPVAVLLVDDQEPFRATARDVVGSTEGFELVGEVSTGEAAVQAVEALSPDVVIIDKRMPGMGGIEASRLMKARNPRLVVVMVSVEDPEPPVQASSGATAFVRKQQLSRSFLREVWRDHRPGP